MRNPLIVSCLGLVLATALAHAQDATDDSAGDPSDDDVAAPDPEISSAIDRFAGELDERIAIAVPKFHGIEPRLALAYHSSDRNSFGGWGWSLAGLKQIVRMSPGRGAPTWTTADQFVLDG